VAAPLGRVGAGQSDQALFQVPLDLHLVGPRWLGPSVDCCKEAFRDKAPADPHNGARSDAQGSDDVIVGVLRSRRGVGQEEDTGMDQFASGCLTQGNQPLQLSPFFRGHGHAKLIHGGTPVPEVNPVAQFSSIRIANYLPIED
jgi:hypothetical protein